MCRINCKNELLDKKVWVSCSGGIDSIAGAHYLFKKLKLDVSLFHFNHGNGAVNDSMEEGVVNFARKYNIHLEIKRLNKCEEDEDNDGSLEAYYREKRLEALQSTVAGFNQVVFCQHLNDCVESYLMNCFNGVGEYCPIPISTTFDMTRVVRPFLLTPKKALYNYANNYSLLEYVTEDPTNSNTKYRRNWVRNRALPVIEEHYPGIQKVVLKKMEREYSNILYQDRMTCPNTGYVWEGK